MKSMNKNSGDIYDVAVYSQYVVVRNG